MVIILARPAVLNYTGNAVKYYFVINGGSLSQKLEMQLLDRDGNVICYNQYPIGDTNSYLINVQVQQQLDSYFNFAPPPATTNGIQNEALPIRYQNVFTMRYRIVDFGTPAGAWTDDGYSHIAIKGGIGMMVPGDDINFNADYNVTNGTWFPFTGDASHIDGHYMSNLARSGSRTLHYQECGWLLYMSRYANSQYVEYIVVYRDGSNAAIQKPLQDPGFGIWDQEAWWIPIGVEQCGLDPTGKGVNEYYVSISTIAADITTIKIIADYRPNYNPIDFYWRNSFGGIDHIRTRGKFSVTTNSSSKDVEQNAYSLTAQDGINPFYYGDMRPKWTVNTGMISRNTAIALQEILLRKGSWILKENKFVPVRVTSDNLKILETSDNLWNLSFEFEAAGSLSYFPINNVI